MSISNIIKKSNEGLSHMVEEISLPNPNLDFFASMFFDSYLCHGL